MARPIKGTPFLYGEEVRKFEMRMMNPKPMSREWMESTPIAEELFFRKWMVNYLERATLKPVYILILTSFMFFLGHTDIHNFYFRFDSLLFGIVLYYIYNKHRDVRNNLIMTSISILI